MLLERGFGIGDGAWMQASLTCLEVQCHSVLPGDFKHAPVPSKSELGADRIFIRLSQPYQLLPSAVPVCDCARSMPGITWHAMAKVKDA